LQQEFTAKTLKQLNISSQAIGFVSGSGSMRRNDAAP
jgi:hypothetical protein